MGYAYMEDCANGSATKDGYYGVQLEMTNSSRALRTLCLGPAALHNKNLLVKTRASLVTNHERSPLIEIPLMARHQHARLLAILAVESS